MEKGRNTFYVSGERRESSLSFGSFSVFIVIMENQSWKTLVVWGSLLGTSRQLKSYVTERKKKDVELIE